MSSEWLSCFNKFTANQGSFIRKVKNIGLIDIILQNLLRFYLAEFLFTKIDEEDSSPWSWVKSVYFDNDDNYVYSNRIKSWVRVNLLDLDGIMIILIEFI